MNWFDSFHLSYTSLWSILIYYRAGNITVKYRPHEKIILTGILLITALQCDFEYNSWCLIYMVCILCQLVKYGDLFDISVLNPKWWLLWTKLRWCTADVTLLTQYTRTKNLKTETDFVANVIWFKYSNIPHCCIHYSNNKQRSSGIVSIVSFQESQSSAISNRHVLMQHPFYELEVWLQEGRDLVIRDSCGKFVL